MARQPRALVVALLVIAASFATSTAARAVDQQQCSNLHSCGSTSGIATGEGFELGLYVPGGDGRAHDVSGGASSCAGCRWEVVPACDGNSPGTGDNDLSCGRALYDCEATGGTLVEVYLKQPAQTWRVVNTFCSNPRRPVVTPAQIAAAAAQALKDMSLPAPGFRSQPPGGTAVNLPTVFWSDAAAPMEIDVTLLGFSARLTASLSSWRWDFGDGGALTSSRAGAPYPNQSISHTYRIRGSFTATVTSTWVGRVVVPGVGELPIAETVTRATQRPVVVREARTELVSDQR